MNCCNPRSGKDFCKMWFKKNLKTDLMNEETTNQNTQLLRACQEKIRVAKCVTDS